MSTFLGNGRYVRVRKSGGKGSKFTAEMRIPGVKREKQIRDLTPQKESGFRRKDRGPE
jgi:hypothetical protein